MEKQKRLEFEILDMTINEIVETLVAQRREAESREKAQQVGSFVIRECSDVDWDPDSLPLYD